jgi:murein DD-endopeptidase MepM/ murein hydrolase activator NlpD
VRAAWAAAALLLLLAACSSAPRPPPPPVVSEAPQAAGNTYLVQPGDSIYSIARELHLTVRALIDANQLRAPYQLQPGQRLVLPNSGFYLVAKGDSLSVIAKRSGVPFATLARMNNLSAPYVLQPGQKLLLPAGGTAAPPPSPSPPAAQAAPAALVAREAVPPSPAAHSAAPPPPAAAPAPQAAAAVPPPAPLPPPPAKSGHGFVWPVKGEVIQEYGSSGKGQHNDGINIAAPRGSAVVAAESGIVAYAGNELRGFGNLLLIKHEDGWMTAYAHNDQLLVKRGEVVRRGQKIATVGESGGVTQPQLHFELRQGTRAVDPVPVLSGKALPAAAEGTDPG